MAYSLGNVKPWVAAAANEVGPKFGIRTIGGYSFRNIAGTSTLSDHALGLALDFMCDIPTGNNLASYVQANAGRLSVTYIIHNRRIWSVARQREGWRAYTGVNPHTDHVHVSFASKPTGSGANASNVASIPNPIVPGLPIPVPDNLPGDVVGGTVGTAKALYNAMKSISDALLFILNPNSWVRVLMFLGGLLLLATAISLLVKNQRTIIQAAETAGNIAKKAKVASNAS
jgi:hypothetical protein